MPKNYPVVTPVAELKKPIVYKPNKEITWSFSFRYFKQIDYFGLGDADGKWYFSLIERLKDLSNQKVDDLLKNYSSRNGYRFHPINWESRNVPIQRSDFTWINHDVLNNEEEFPFYQFQISTALGRVIGYFDENHEHFHILLLDHKHNMQPSKINNYKVDDTTNMYCAYTSLLIDIDKAKGKICEKKKCDCKEILLKIPTNGHFGKFAYFKVDDDYYDEFIKKTAEKSLKEIIELGLLND